MAIARPPHRIQLDLFASTPEPTASTLEQPLAWVETYWVKRPSGRYRYYRFCHLTSAGDIRSVVRHHIPGGNIGSGVAQTRAAAIKLAIACGDSASAIALRIKGWQKQPRK